MKRQSKVGSQLTKRSELGSRKRSRPGFAENTGLIESLELAVNSKNGSPRNFKGGSPVSK